MAKGCIRSKTELELKLAGAPGDVAALRSSSLFEEFARSGEGAARLVSTYYDTPDGALHSAGISLRLREGAGGRIQTLKREKGAGAVSRKEEEQALRPGETFPRPVQDRKAAKTLAGAEGLAPMSRVIADRWSVILDKDRTRIEAAFDIGRIEAWRGGAPFRVASLAEAEIELIDGEPKALFELAARIIEESGGRLRPSILAKAERAQRLAEESPGIAPEPPVKLGGADDAAAALAAALIAVAARIVELIPAITELRLPEGVHQMRIALRRFRSLEQTFRRALKTKKLRRLARRARDFANALGPARDWDVFVDETLPPLETPGGDDEGFLRLKARAEALRAAAWEKAAATIASPAFSGFALDLLKAAHLQSWRRKAGKGLRASARDFASAALDERLAAAREAARPIDSPDPAARHPLRIALKKLRYAAQAFRTLYPREARKAAMAALSRLQEGLGAVNDAVTAQRLANEAAMGQGKKAARASGFVAGFHAAAGEAKARAVGEDWRLFAATAPFWREPEE